MSVAVVLFTRDLRLNDNPTLQAAVRSADQVVPLFVLDERILGSDYNRPNRAAFLVDCLRDLDGSLRDRGSGLVVRRGEVAEEVSKVAAGAGAGAVHVSGDVSAYARARARRLAERLAADDRRLVVHPETLFAVPPGDITASGRDHMSVFTPYHRRWDRHALRESAPAPRAVSTPSVRKGRVPGPDAVSSGRVSPDLPPGGESEGRRRFGRWLRDGVADYADNHDPMAADGTSRLSPYLHFGCLSPLEMVRRSAEKRSSGAAEFVRQLAWRDFHAQVLAARPDATRNDYRSRGDRWDDDPDEIAAWKEGRTGFPVVDAGMRQLRQEGWMHNRARLITGHFLVKTLNVDWRIGAQHFIDWLVDGDTANNTMNWQWVAGTGTISQFNRSYNMTTQARRHDPRGAYVRRYVPELAEVDDAYVHEPWLLPPDQFDRLGYPEPVVDQDQARERIRRARGR